MFLSAEFFIVAFPIAELACVVESRTDFSPNFRVLEVAMVLFTTVVTAVVLLLVVPVPSIILDMASRILIGALVVIPLGLVCFTFISTFHCTGSVGFSKP